MKRARARSLRGNRRAEGGGRAPAGGEREPSLVRPRAGPEGLAQQRPPLGSSSSSECSSTWLERIAHITGVRAAAVIENNGLVLASSGDRGDALASFGSALREAAWRAKRPSPLGHADEIVVRDMQGVVFSSRMLGKPEAELALVTLATAAIPVAELRDIVAQTPAWGRTQSRADALVTPAGRDRGRTCATRYADQAACSERPARRPRHEAGLDESGKRPLHGALGHAGVLGKRLRGPRGAVAQQDRDARVVVLRERQERDHLAR